MLRVRNDLIFAKTSFLDQHREGMALPRGDAAILRERVLISNTYTLNPFAYERLSFHFSDWFHYGRTEDVRRLWQVPVMSLSEATFFDHRLHPDGALWRERQHRCRVAVEQHAAFPPASGGLGDLQLDHAGDLHSRVRPLDYLCDNFVVCDLQAAVCVLPKYAAELTEAPRTLHCFSAADWRELAAAAPGERAAVATRQGMRATSPEAGPFPRRYPAASLYRTRPGSPALEICAAGVDGVVSHGPYDTLPRGQYVARLFASVVDGSGKMVLRVTAGAGDRFVAQARIDVSEHNSLPPEVEFDIVDPVAPLVEVVVETSGLAAICITGLEIARRPGSSLAERARLERRGIRPRMRRAWRWARRRLPGGRRAGPSHPASDGALAR